MFRTMVWPAYKEAGISPDRLQEVVERLKPLSIASLVAAYESAMDETKREGIARRTQSSSAGGRRRPTRHPARGAGCRPSTSRAWAPRR